MEFPFPNDHSHSVAIVFLHKCLFSLAVHSSFIPLFTFRCMSFTFCGRHSHSVAPIHILLQMIPITNIHTFHREFHPFSLTLFTLCCCHSHSVAPIHILLQIHSHSVARFFTFCCMIIHILLQLPLEKSVSYNSYRIKKRVYINALSLFSISKNWIERNGILLRTNVSHLQSYDL